MLPGRDGFELLHVIRRTSTAAVLMVTARDALAEGFAGTRWVSPSTGNNRTRSMARTAVEDSIRVKLISYPLYLYDYRAKGLSGSASALEEPATGPPTGSM